MMKTNLHLTFENGKCTEAFGFYEKVFNTKSEFRMTYGEAPPGAPCPEGAKDLVMHMSMPLGSILLMGADIPPTMPSAPFAAFEIALQVDDADEVKRLFAALSDGGSVMMPPTETFWSPMFCMLTDKYGVGWMVSVPGPEMRKP
jgi:PhnB protein